MTPRPTILAAFILAASSALPAAAQNIKPGLWEVNNVVASGNSEVGSAIAAMQKHIAGMPAEKRQRMEEMMRQQGINISTGAGGGVVARMCVTREMAEHNQVPLQQEHGNCSHKRSPLVGNSMNVSFTCTSPQANGEGVVSFSGDSAYSVKMTISSSARGKPETMSVDATGKWLGADCGTIKPVAAS